MFNGLHDNKIRCITEDKEGNILIGTNVHGLEIFKGEQFITYSVTDGLINNQVWAIIQDAENQLWFGTNGGISVYNNIDTNKIFMHYNQFTNNISNQIRFLKQDSKSNIWIGTIDQGIIKFDFKKNVFEYINIINSYFPSSGKIVTALEIDNLDNLWIGTIEGLLEVRIKDYSVETITQEKGIPGNDISALFVDKKGQVWVGAKGKGIAHSYADEYKILDIKGNITPVCITEDKEGKIWIGTETHGVIVLQDDLEIKRYTIANGLLSNLINFINFDDNNNIYAGTNRGLNKIVQNEDKIITYTKKSGFTGIETRNNATFKDNQGKLWFGTVNGVMCYDYKLDLESDIEPLTHINQMVVNGENMIMKPKLKLSHTQKSIEFRYYSICLTDPDAVRYKIMLEGFDNDWINMGIQNSKSYSLLPGKYTFKVIARNNEGNWNSKPKTYSFRILAPFYQRGWFIITAIVIFVSGIFSYIKIRERNLIREKRILEDKVKERTLALSKANEELEEKNKDITDSIKYAKRIQFAILPPDIPFKDTFILFKPKDIVSGDFFWLISHAGKEFIAAVDCTGHGVPGAFMSFIGYTSLNKIVIEKGIYQPAAILKHLNEEVASTLHQKEDDMVRDGMDIALVCYDPAKKELQYSGAYNPLWLIRKGELIETKANRFAIGRSISNESEFTNHVLKIQKDDTIYLFSDGYVDQFGGEEGKKFKIKNFRDLVLSMQSKTTQDQSEFLNSTIEKWKGNFEQIDDILVIGRKFS